MEKLIKVLKLSRSNLVNYILETFRNEDTITDYDNYILIMRDETYPVLVCHIDTVHNDENPLFEERPIIVINDYIISPKGLGADDRAGVYFLLEYGINYPVNLLFCNYEECGGIGVKKLIKDHSEILKNSKCFIEIDRANIDEYVSYVENEIAFENIFKPYYKEAIGSYSDIYDLSSHYGIASVNLSIGYKYQHTKKEILYPKIFEITNAKLSKILPLLERQYTCETFQTFSYNDIYNHDFDYYNYTIPFDYEYKYLYIHPYEVIQIENNLISIFNYLTYDEKILTIEEALKMKQLPKKLKREVKKWLR